MPTDYERYLEAKKRADTLIPRALTGVEAPVAETTGVDIPSLVAPSTPAANFLSDVVFSSEGSAKDFGQAFRRVSGGTLRGATLGAIDVFPEEKNATSSRVAEFIGTMAPWSLAGKAIGAIPLIAKLGQAAPVIGSAVRGGIAGATVGAAEQGISAARGNGFDAESVGESAATFAVLDGGLTALGKFGQFLLKTRQYRRFMAEFDAAVKRGDIPEPTKQELEGIKKAAMVGDGRPRPVPVTETDTEALTGVVDLKPRLIERSGKVVNLSIENPVYTFDRLGKPMKDAFYEPARDAEHIANVRIDAIRKATDKMAKTLRLGSKESQRIHAFAYSEQKGGEELLRAAGIETPTLNIAEKRAYDWMRQQLEKRYSEINAARAIAGTEPLPKVENYFTFSHATDILRRDGHSLTSATPSAINQAMKTANETAFQFEKRGFFGRKKLNLDALNLFKRYNESAIRHIEMTPIVSRNSEMLASRVKSGEEMISFAEKSPEAYKFLNQWNSHIAGMRASIFSPQVERVAEKLNRNIAFATLSFSARSVMIQPVAINNTVAVIGPKWTVSGVRSLLSGEAASAMEKSRVLLGREFDATVMDAFGIGGRVNTVIQKAGEAGLKPLKAADMVTAQASWLGAYNKATKLLKMSEKDAIRYADDIVVKTQASASPIDMSPIQRTAVGRSATLFQTFAINEFNMLRRELAGIGNKSISKKEAAKRLMRWIVGINIVNFVYEDVLKTNSPYPAPINAAMRANERGQSPTRAFLLELAGILPIVGGLKYGGSPFGATASTIEDARDIITGTASNRKTAQTVGKILGVPGTMQISKLQRLMEEKK